VTVKTEIRKSSLEKINILNAIYALAFNGLASKCQKPKIYLTDSVRDNTRKRKVVKGHMAGTATRVALKIFVSMRR
jgi:hypothetical protein